MDKADMQMSTAEQFAALSRVSTALMRELDEHRLLHLIAETACSLTGAKFAAFSLRPADESGQPSVPSEGNLFHLAAVVGVTEDQEALFRRMPLGGEGLLAPIFRHGISVLVPDVLARIVHSPETSVREARDAAREVAFAYAHGQAPSDALRSMGVPGGHPHIRSFLGVPLLDFDEQVRGGLLLGHPEPNRFTPEDEALLKGLAAQAAVALENARLYRMTRLRAQELDAIFQSVADGMTLVDRQGKILRENEAARQVRKAMQTCAQGERLLEALLYEPARVALRDGVVQDSIVTIDDEDKTKEYLVTTSPLRSKTSSSRPLQMSTEEANHAVSTMSSAVVIWHDVTERRIREAERQAHAEVEKRLVLLQLILDELPGSVYLVRGKNAQLVLANCAAKTLWGAEWPQGQPFTSFLKEHGIHIFGVDGQPLESSQLATIRVLRDRKSVYQHQESIRHADGSSISVLVNAVALHAGELSVSVADDAEGAEPAAIVTHQDVTPFKEAERIKDEFIGIAAHELRTPLAVLKGFAQTLLVQTARGKGTELADWQLEALQAIDQATARLVELMEDLLDVTRLQAGRLELHAEPTDLVPLIQRIGTRTQMTAEQHQLFVQSMLTHVVVNVDPRRMEQVFNNLLGNAIKYSPEGGAVHILIRLDEKTNMAVLSVQDHGIGIPAHQQSRLFGRFARAENAQAYGIGGTGLGLYLCRELVERQGGHIWFESHEGEGSTFFVTLPILSSECTSL